MVPGTEFGPATPAEAALAERRAFEILEGFLALRWRTGWAEERTHCFVARHGGEMVCSVFALELPLYWPDGAGTLTPRPVAAVDALVTPARYRRRGFAGALLEWVQRWAEDQGIAATALFSEIGPAYYERRGFRLVPLPFRRGPLPPAAETVGGARSAARVDRWEDARSRPFTMSDLDAVMRVYEAAARVHPLAVSRDAGYWRYHLDHSRFVEDLHSDEPDMRDFVVNRGEVTAYVRSRSDGDIFTVLEAAGMPGEEDTLRGLIDSELERASREGCLRVVLHLQPTLPPPAHLQLRESWYETFVVRPTPDFQEGFDRLFAGAPEGPLTYLFRPDYF